MEINIEMLQKFKGFNKFLRVFLLRILQPIDKKMVEKLVRALQYLLYYWIN